MRNQLNWYICFWPYPAFSEAALISLSRKLRTDMNDLNRDGENYKMSDSCLISHIEN